MRFIAIVAVLALFCGVCHAADQPPQKKTIYAMGGIPINISAWGMQQDTFDMSVLMISSRIEELEAMMSTYRPDSEISRLNNGEHLASIPADLATVIHTSLGYSVVTDGAFDITVKPLVELWKTSTKAGRLPTADEVAQASAAVGYTHVSLEPGGVPRMDTAGVKLDLGGIAKGYFADEAVRLLIRGGANRAIVDCGGDVFTWQAPVSAGKGQPQQRFRVGVNHPLKPGQLLGVIDVDHGAVVTSGDYERFYEIDGKRYCHIFDPRTGWPVQGMMSVTLLAPTGIEADALATGVFVLGPVEGPKFVEAHDGLEAVIVIDDGAGGMEVYVSPGLIEHFSVVQGG